MSNSNKTEFISVNDKLQFYTIMVLQNLHLLITTLYIEYSIIRIDSESIKTSLKRQMPTEYQTKVSKLQKYKEPL